MDGYGDRGLDLPLAWDGDRHLVPAGEETVEGYGGLDGGGGSGARHLVVVREGDRSAHVADEPEVAGAVPAVVEEESSTMSYPYTEAKSWEGAPAGPPLRGGRPRARPKGAGPARQWHRQGCSGRDWPALVLPSHTRNMKTAISVPNGTYERVVRMARELGVSRSELFSRAAERYLDDADDARVTELVNEVLARDAAAQESNLAAAEASRARLLEGDDW